jgi:FAD/FMN-containing dehydrogenase
LVLFGSRVVTSHRGQQPQEVRAGPVANVEAAVRELRASLRGQLIRPGDQSYDEARKALNAMIDRRPALIARCAGAADAIAAVRFAQENRVVVSVKGGAHNFPGNSLCDGGLVIDFSR